jgi:hypothetical protein
MGIQIKLRCAHLSFSIKQTTTLTHIPLVHETFPIHFNKLAMDSCMVNVSAMLRMPHCLDNKLTDGTEVVSLIIDTILYKAP